MKTKLVEGTIGELRSFSQQHLPIFLADTEDEQPCSLQIIRIENDRCMFIGSKTAKSLSLAEAVKVLLLLPTDLEVWLALPHVAQPKPLGMVVRQYVPENKTHFALLYTRD